jgi:hypothetical protein
VTKRVIAKRVNGRIWLWDEKLNGNCGKIQVLEE